MEATTGAMGGVRVKWVSFLGWGLLWAIKNRLGGRFAGVARMAGFGVYVACGFSMAGAAVTGVSAKRSHRASKVASVQVLGT